MQPYQAASKRIIEQGSERENLAESAIGTAASIAGGSAIYGRIAPFLSKYIPTDLAVKGITKINPTLGKFVGGAIANGTNFEDVANFVKDKFGNKEEGKGTSPLDELEQISPRITGWIKKALEVGKGPDQLLQVLANLPPDLQQEARKVEGQVGMPLADYIAGLFGSQPEQSKAALQPSQPQQGGQPQQQAQEPSSQQMMTDAYKKLMSM